uniref:Uncharacterized protein n=1 Tax=Romanomermis culicivorax TaxID=13658 RepID=A0A915HFR7_ROMCU
MTQNTKEKMKSEREQLDAYHLELARNYYFGLINQCCNMEGVKETLPTKEQERKFLQHFETEMTKYKVENPGGEIHELGYNFPKCTKVVYELKEKPTVLTLFGNMPNSTVGKGDIKETLPTKQHEKEFVIDLIKRIKQYRKENPGSQVLLEEYGTKTCNEVMHPRVKETLPTEEHKEKFSKDLDGRIKQYKTENPHSQIRFENFTLATVTSKFSKYFFMTSGPTLALARFMLLANLLDKSAL